ncbi:MAG: hypothetical protein AAFY88_26020, partial [Acidobacteriota bacterium]
MAGGGLRWRGWWIRAAVALLLAAFVTQVAMRAAPDSALSPKLFTAFHSVDTYRELADPFKPRLFSYVLARPFLAPSP